MCRLRRRKISGTCRCLLRTFLQRTPRGGWMASGVVRFTRPCSWQASRTTKCRAAGQAAHCTVSTAEDKQRTERRTAAIRFIKSSAKKEVQKPWFLAAFCPLCRRGQSGARPGREKPLAEMLVAGIPHDEMLRRRAGGTLQCQYSGGKQRNARRTAAIRFIKPFDK